jgi:hypothetical protein
MKVLALLFILAISFQAVSQQLPKGVTLESTACKYAPGLFSTQFQKSNELIGMILPDACYFNGVEEDGVNKYFIADFYNDNKKDTFDTHNEAMTWIVKTMEEYYQPLVITKWQKLKVQPPKVSLKYPWDRSYKLDKLEGIFKSKIQSENRLTLLRTVPGGKSEVFFIVRTPNTAKLSVDKAMEMTAQMNRAINLKGSTAEYVVGGKSFKTAQNSFMAHMDQYHFWYADEQEIIYVNYNLLKDEKIRYPEVMKAILNSIAW